MKFRVTWKHKDIGDVELVEIEELDARSTESAYQELRQKRPGYVSFVRIEKITE